jgi:hypothetical protein
VNVKEWNGKRKGGASGASAQWDCSGDGNRILRGCMRVILYVESNLGIFGWDEGKKKKVGACHEELRSLHCVACACSTSIF